MRDQTYGQASAIPVGDDNPEDEEAGGASTREAMAYLRTVRYESLIAFASREMR
jgi:hypothetical protein